MTATMPDISSLIQGEGYYEDSAFELGLFPEYADWKLPNVFDFFGYSRFPHRESPCALIDLAQAPGEILSVRYFAPKTSSVSAEGDASEMGWRQLIRIKARKGSRAIAAGLESAFVLVNYQQVVKNVRENPFASAPLYTQVMMVRGAASASWPAYWLVFDRDEWRTSSILATFHGGDVSAKGTTYHLPLVCAQCHGRDKKSPHLNFLDIDHWYDRGQKKGDFSVVQKSPAKVTSMGECKIAPLDVVRAVNLEIQTFNNTVNLPTASFVRAALDSWVDKHPSGGKVLPPIERAYGINGWRTKDDKKLLGLLNKYCYRCHGTTKFDVFDRAAVLQRRDKATALINAREMPLDRRADRQLSKSEIKKITKLLAKMK